MQNHQEKQQNTEVEDVKPLNLVRLMVLGNTATGKTSLIRKLKGEPIVEVKEGVTSGIDMTKWSIPDSAITANIWDFGGKLMAHSTHQIFLRERCVYIIVVDAASENQTANEQAKYWLEHIKAFANSAKVLLVANKVDKTKVHLDREILAKKYPNIIGFHTLSCTAKTTENEQAFDQFTQSLIAQLKAVATHKITLSKNQDSVFNKIKALVRDHAFIDQEAFDDLWEAYQVDNDGLSKTAFLSLLDDLGEIIHFSALEWTEAYVINPYWLTSGIYALLYSDKITQQKGVLRHADAVAILQAQTAVDEQGETLTYPKEKCRFVSDVIKQFKLRYQLPIAGSFYVLPDRFPKEQPNLDGYFNKDDAKIRVKFIFDNFLPRSLMPNIICILHDDIAQNVQDEELVWRYGVILKHETSDAKACWTVDYDTQTLMLWVQGDRAEEYLQILHGEVLQIFARTKGLSATENRSSPQIIASNKEVTVTKNPIANPSATTTPNSTAKEIISELKASLATIKLIVEKSDKDFFARVSAYGDLQRIEIHLSEIEEATPEPDNTLQLLLNSVQDGTLGVIKLAEEIDGAEQAIEQLKQRVASVSALLSLK